MRDQHIVRPIVDHPNPNSKLRCRCDDTPKSAPIRVAVALRKNLRSRCCREAHSYANQTLAAHLRWRTRACISRPRHLQSTGIGAGAPDVSSRPLLIVGRLIRPRGQEADLESLCHRHKQLSAFSRRHAGTAPERSKGFRSIATCNYAAASGLGGGCTSSSVTSNRSRTLKLSSYAVNDQRTSGRRTRDEVPVFYEKHAPIPHVNRERPKWLCLQHVFGLLHSHNSYSIAREPLLHNG